MNKLVAGIFVTISIVSLSSRVRCESRLDIHRLEIQAMTTAQTVAELRGRLATIKKLATEELACRMQLKYKMLPFSCYRARALRIVNRWPLDGRIYSNLNDRCLQIAGRTNELDLKKIRVLPSKCRTVARSRIQINRYKAGRSWQGI